jgi:hypothetical protein
MIFHLGYRYDGNGRVLIVMCSKAQPQVEALFAQCDKLVPHPLNGMEVPTHFPDGSTKDVAIETPNPLAEGKFTLTSQVEGAQICTPPTNRT